MTNISLNVQLLIVDEHLSILFSRVDDTDSSGEVARDKLQILSCVSCDWMEYLVFQYSTLQVSWNVSIQKYNTNVDLFRSFGYNGTGIFSTICIFSDINAHFRFIYRKSNPEGLPRAFVYKEQVKRLPSRLFLLFAKTCVKRNIVLDVI